jgi:hypothetical protein
LLVQPAPRRRLLGPVFLSALVSLLVSGGVVLAMQFLFVPSGAGWRRLVHEGAVSVPGNQPFKVHYPSSFARPPSLLLDAQGAGDWYYRIDEQTEDHFVITNTTVNSRTNTPVILQLKWRAEGGRR